jgi:hypothetical protein
MTTTSREAEQQKEQKFRIGEIVAARPGSVKATDFHVQPLCYFPQIRSSDGLVGRCARQAAQRIDDSS